MKPELTPTEARSGIISGRVITVLTVSSMDALIAISYTGWFLFRT